MSELSPPISSLTLYSCDEMERCKEIGKWCIKRGDHNPPLDTTIAERSEGDDSTIDTV